MKTILITSFILMSFIGMSQITITDSDFAQGGDTAMVSFSDETTLDLVTTGADVIWDFSGINISGQSIDTFHDVSDADLLYQIVFNNGFTNPDHESTYFTPWTGGGLGQLGGFGIDVNEIVQFTGIRSDSVINTGIGFEIMGQGIPGESDTIDVQYYLPMNYLDAWTSNSYTNVDLNPAFDAIYRRYQWRDSEVDGWGEITTPWGTFDAIRVKSNVISVDSLYIGQFSFWAELPVPDQIEYQWFTNGQKMPIFSVITADVGGNETITEIKFKDKKRYFTSNDEFEFAFEIYPNPAIDKLNIQIYDDISLIQIFDINGKLIHSEIPINKLITLNTSEWSTGVYTVQIQASNRVSNQKLLIE